MKLMVRAFQHHPLRDEAREQLDKFFSATPLYTKLPLTPELRNACFEELFILGGKVDMWCTQCKKESTFSLAPLLGETKVEQLYNNLRATTSIEMEHDSPALEVINALRNIVLRCARDRSHTIEYVCRHTSKMRRVAESDEFTYEEVNISLYKIGQEPSPSDIVVPRLRKYVTELSDVDWNELKKAVSLASHNIGIGSFVYLRRILERLINETAEEHLDEGALAEFRKQRVKEKIAMIKEWLPRFFTDNTTLYTILSKGVHELTEEECIAAFEPCQLGIELILDEHISNKEKQAKETAVAGELSKLSSKLNQT